jgi:hypothetical protein
MRCSRAERLISDHIDGLLSPKHAQKLENHLKKCLKCKNLQSEMRSMVNVAKQLEDVSLSKDLWPSIKSRISEKETEKGLNIKRLFPSFSLHPRELIFSACAFFSGILLASLFHSAIPYMQTNVRIQEKVTSNQQKEAEYHYQQAIAALNQVITAQNVKLSPEVSAVFKDNLDNLDSWINTFRTVLDENPGDRDANEYLMTCYQNKLKLLSEIRNITMNSI